MALEAPTSSSSFFSPWPERLRHSAIILLVAAIALAVLVMFDELSPLRASAVFVCIAAAALGQVEIGIPCVVGGALSSATLRYFSSQ